MSRIVINTPEFRDIAWMDKAACRDLPHETAMRMFFPEKGQQWKEAKQICCGRPETPRGEAVPACPVKDECLLYALSFEPDGVVGIWGGTTHSERRKIAAGVDNHKTSIMRSYRNLDRLGELLGLVSSVNRGTDNVAP